MKNLFVLKNFFINCARLVAKIQKIPTIFLLLILNFIVYNKWIYNPILSYGDWSFHFFNSSIGWLTPPQIWLTQYNLGGLNLSLSSWLTTFAYGALGYLQLNSNIGDKILFMLPIVVFSVIGSYILLKKIIPSSPAVVVGVVVYCYSTYFLLITGGVLTLAIVYAVSPLILYFYIRTLEERNYTLAVLTGLFASIAGMFEFRGFYMLLWVCFIYFLYHVFVIGKARIKTFLVGFIPLLIVSALNFFWLFGLAKTNILANNSLFSRGLFGDGFLNINFAMTLFHSFWGSKPGEFFVVHPIPVYFWLIPCAAMLGLFLNRRNKQIFFFGIVALLGILLTKQSAPPFSDLYLFLYNHLPGFNAFREASKFYFLIALGYSVLIAAFIDVLWKNWKEKKWQIYGKYLITIFIVFIFLWNTKSLITGEIRTLFVPKKVPNDYLIVKDFILKQNDYFRTLWVPTDSRWSIYTNNHPKVTAVGMIDAAWTSFIIDKINHKTTGAELMVELLSLSYSDNLLSSSSIKYVIIPLEDKISDDNFFLNYGKSRQYYIDQLDKINWLRKVDVGTKEIVVYENADYRPHIYITNNQESIKNNQSFSKIDYKFINSTEYSFSIKNVSESIYLNFSESYHPDWEIRIGSFNWLDVLKNKNYFISDKNHFQNDATLNSYLFDPKSICAQFACKQNSDGSYDISGTLYFKSQSYVYLGLTVSGSTLIIVLCFLSFMLGKHLYEKNK